MEFSIKIPAGISLRLLKDDITHYLLVVKDFNKAGFDTIKSSMET